MPITALPALDELEIIQRQRAELGITGSEFREILGRVDMRKIGVFMCFLIAGSQALWCQRAVPAHIVVTTGHYYGEEPPILTASDLSVTQNGIPRTITSVIPLRGDRAALELFVLVDNCSSCEVGPKFDELRRFIAR